MSKPTIFIATKPIFINGVLHQPGQTVTVYPVNTTAVEEQRAADLGDGLVAPADFDPSMIVGAALVGQFVGAPAVGVVTHDDAVDSGITVEEEAKPRAAGGKPKSNVLD